MRIFAGLLAGLLATTAHAGEREVSYGEIPGWVPEPVSAAENNQSGGAFQAIYSQVRMHIEEGGTQTHTAWRIKLKSAEALPIGNLTMVWNPDTSTPVVHLVRIHRGEKVIDVLENAKFSVFQREGGLEQSMLDGLLTASLQVPGLRIGDELEFASTTTDTNPIFGDKSFGLVFLTPQLAPGSYAAGIDWTEGQKPRWKAFDAAKKHLVEGPNSVTMVMQNAPDVVFPAKAPARYQMGRVIAFSDYADWNSVSRQFADFYLEGRSISGIADLSQKVAAIKAANPNLKDRAQAALKLVQQEIRYVFTGMNGGNYVPASPAETWDRRFADCKGVTVLLLGILDALDVKAVPVLVSSDGGAVVDELLPTPGAFDHVLVRTNIGGEDIWLDGTRTGDPMLRRDADVPYRHALPIDRKGSDLETIDWQPPRLPSELVYLDIDSTEGVETKAKITMVQVLRSDAAIGMKNALTMMSSDTAKQAIEKQYGGWIDPEEADWRYDEDTGAIAITVSGPGDLDWDTDEDYPGYVQTYLPQGGFSPPGRRERPSAQDQTLPYVNSGAEFSCSVTRVRLPEVEDSAWVLTAKAIKTQMFGVAYYRLANLSNGTVEMVRSSRTLENEIPASLATKDNGRIDDFENSKASVRTEVSHSRANLQVDGELPDFDSIDWIKESDICLKGTGG